MSKKFILLFSGIAMLAVSSCQTTKDLVRKPKANEGPCPAALVLWDAARKVQIGTPQVYSNVGFTGEITNVRTYCTYVGTNPIRASVEIDFAFGRGPAAEGDIFDAPYFVSVTRKDRAVIAKESFAQRIKFNSPGQIITRTETIDSLIIPRKEQTTSGSNFEIIVGFHVNADELAYARSGKRFRVDAGTR